VIQFNDRACFYGRLNDLVILLSLTLTNELLIGPDCLHSTYRLKEKGHLAPASLKKGYFLIIVFY